MVYTVSPDFSGERQGGIPWRFSNMPPEQHGDTNGVIQFHPVENQSVQHIFFPTLLFTIKIHEE
jgi:hypothetical protein